MEFQEVPDEVVVSAVDKADTFVAEENAGPVERIITIPPGLEVIGGPNAGQAGVVHLDRENKRAYRAVDLTRYPDEEEFTRKDFTRKVEVGTRDTTGLTPRLYGYDPVSLILEMELIEGGAFTGKVSVTPEAARRFMEKLREFHSLGLYHGDLFPRNHWILTPQGEIRLIDPIWMPVDDPESGTTVEKQQATDRALAVTRLKEFGVDESILDEVYPLNSQSGGEGALLE